MDGCTQIMQYLLLLFGHFIFGMTLVKNTAILSHPILKDCIRKRCWGLCNVTCQDCRKKIFHNITNNCGIWIVLNRGQQVFLNSLPMCSGYIAVFLFMNGTKETSSHALCIQVIKFWPHLTVSCHLRAENSSNEVCRGEGKSFLFLGKTFVRLPPPCSQSQSLYYNGHRHYPFQIHRRCT